MVVQYEDASNELKWLGGGMYMLRHHSGIHSWLRRVPRDADVRVETCNGRPDAVFFSKGRKLLAFMPLGAGFDINVILAMFTGRFVM